MTRTPPPGATAPGDTTGWMDRDNATHRWLHQNGPHVQPDPRLRLERLRKNLIRAAMEGPGRTRTLRVILYTLTTSQGDPETDFTRLRAYAQDAFQIKREIHDTASRPDRAPAPQHRNGWLAARLLMRQGAADGVIAISRHVISPDDALYERELLWIGDHFAFIDLIIPESR
ncbi:hypothetical protein OG895_43315 [Streptomyces sp. NBC_00201]|uniref:hypothetical protein n=1 Tax=unclassified Streptomyces TaxID=2593676 RepID=UPI002252C753|nr:MULTISPECIES: hypothetical protein [unclassified Streptomyces]MCX5063726.1 hypothetical protein [Streptomyces sp. NBC_00452]MCX5251881.1 hypothetical protein [Streptomyces sp. NBC_00201]MCX5294216.1 hypothetical protein [Streptomyces sp. NBC_00183]